MRLLHAAYRKSLLAADIAAAILALEAGLLVTNIDQIPSGLAAFLAMRITVKNLLLLVFFLAGWHLVLLCCRVYETGEVAPLRRWKRLIMACTIGSAPVLLFVETSHTGAFRMENAILFWVCALVLLLFNRVCHAAVGALARKRPVRRCLIVGSGPVAMDLYNTVLQAEFPRCEVLGFVDDLGAHTVSEDIRRLTIGSLADLEEIIKRVAVDEVSIGLPMKSCYTQIQRVIEVCEMAGVQCRLPSVSFSYSIARPEIDAAAQHIITLKVVADDFRQVVKRAMDIAGAVVALTVFAPAIAVVAVIVKVTSPGPVIFAQTRFGVNRRRFRMYKFRTMIEQAEHLQASLEGWNEASGPVFKIRDDPRVTPAGRVLRRTSLDELPQLWNVLKGEMSLVGPRPLPERDVARFPEAWLMRRFSVKPGLTCLWQINGRSDIPFDRWIELDLKYIDTWSLALDLKILAKTVSTVVKGQGAA
jgi:exopolysaccharide biosynthesis polyprenyl glycosylphosphotransferase